MTKGTGITRTAEMIWVTGMTGMSRVTSYRVPLYNVS